MSSDVFFDESAYDTQYSTILRYDEDYATAFARINDALPSVEKHFVTQYKNESGKYNTVVRLYYVRQSVEEAKSLQKEVVLYPGEVATDDILNNIMLFGEIAFIKRVEKCLSSNWDCAILNCTYSDRIVCALCYEGGAADAKGQPGCQGRRACRQKKAQALYVGRSGAHDSVPADDRVADCVLLCADVWHRLCVQKL